MRFTVIGQLVKGLANEQNLVSAQEPLTDTDIELDTVDIGKELERVKWFFWHGNVQGALDTIEDVEAGLELFLARATVSMVDAQPTPATRGIWSPTASLTVSKMATRSSKV
jgi:hypothetical protein